MQPVSSEEKNSRNAFEGKLGAEARNFQHRVSPKIAFVGGGGE
jgi:hypothetical protein